MNSRAIFVEKCGRMIKIVQMSKDKFCRSHANEVACISLCFYLHKWTTWMPAQAPFPLVLRRYGSGLSLSGQVLDNLLSTDGFS